MRHTPRRITIARRRLRASIDEAVHTYLEVNGDVPARPASKWPSHLKEAR